MVFSVAFSPDGKSIVSGDDSGTIKLWNIMTGEVIHTFVGHSKRVNSVALSPDGTRIVSGSDDHTIKLWDVKTGEMLLSH
jgi:WD40 repeat protein